jgi:hypothetical protein
MVRLVQTGAAVYVRFPRAIRVTSKPFEGRERVAIKERRTQSFVKRALVEIIQYLT